MIPLRDQVVFPQGVDILVAVSVLSSLDPYSMPSEANGRLRWTKANIMRMGILSGS
jgi:hypothetical protein